MSRPALALAALLAASPAGAATLVVNSLDDNDNGCSPSHCTLREAIDEANSHDTIVFDFSLLPPGDPVIELSSPLPHLEEEGLIIDGYDCTGCGLVAENAALPADGFDLLIGPTIDGSQLPVAPSSDLLILDAQDITIRGLNLRSSGDEAVLIHASADGAVIEGCLIGTDRTGLLAAGNAQYGIYIVGGDDITIGPGNVIAGNGDHGVFVEAANSGVRDLSIVGNLVGVGIDASTPLPNAGSGLVLEGLSAQIENGAVGDGTAAGLNVLSGNGGHGIQVLGEIEDVTFDGNLIGVDGAQVVAVPNGGWGIFVEPRFFDRTRRLVVQGNVVAGNGAGGLHLQGLEDSDVLANFVGTDDLALTNLGNGGDGIEISGGQLRNANAIAVGGTAAADVRC